MTPEMQLMFNIVAGICGSLGMFFLKVQWEQIQDLRKANADLAAKHAEIEVLVAGHYAKREDVDKLGVALFAKLDRIEQKLDQKVDK